MRKPWGWGAYDTWSRRRTVSDLILITYFDAFKGALFSQLEGEDARP